MSVTGDVAREAVLAMLAAEACCKVEELLNGQVHVKVRASSRPPDSPHRRFIPHAHAITAVTTGVGAVITVDEDDRAHVEKALAGADRDAVFEPDTLGRLTELASRHGLKLFGPFPRFVGATDWIVRREPPSGYRVEIVDGPYVLGLSRERWPHAVLRGVNPDRPDVLAARALRGDELVGVAAVSADSDQMWQIGIDVPEAHQGRGIGRALTSAAAGEILARGRVPYYGTTSSNLPSMKCALDAGLRPMWVEVDTRPW